MKDLGMGDTDDTGNDDVGTDVGAITALEKEASDVLKKAKELSEKVTNALKNYQGADDNCNSASNFNQQVQIWEISFEFRILKFV